MCRRKRVHQDHGYAVCFTQEKRRCLLIETTHGLSGDEALCATLSTWHYLPNLGEHPDFANESPFCQAQMNPFTVLSHFCHWIWRCYRVFWTNPEHFGSFQNAWGQIFELSGSTGVFLCSRFTSGSFTASEIWCRFLFLPQFRRSVRTPLPGGQV
jgi:hypothetical protein